MINLLMRRHVVLLITLFYLFGVVGIPVVAYSCVESGEAGVVTYLTTSPRPCYAEVCCDDEQASTSICPDDELPCCDVDVRDTLQNTVILLSDQKTGQAKPLAERPTRFDASRPDVRIASTPAPISIFHASINLPLLI